MRYLRNICWIENIVDIGGIRINNRFRLSSLLIACVLLIHSVFAIQVSAAIYEDGEYLGNSGNLSGYVVPDRDQTTRVVKFPVSFGDEGSTYYLEFSISANRVTDLLVSGQGDKTFTWESLRAGTQWLSLRGTLYHTNSNGPIIRYGICYYDEHEDKYNAMWSEEVASGSDILEKLYLGELIHGYVYHTFVKNLAATGYVHGDLALYSSAT